MIDYKTTKPGDRVKIVGMGAPGYAKLGDIVTVTACNGVNRCRVVNDAGEEVEFVLTCGAQRLELVPPDPTP